MQISFWFGAMLAFTITIGVLGKVHAQQRPGDCRVSQGS